MIVSIHQVAINARQALVRFPWVVLSGFVAAFASIYLIEVNEVTAYAFQLINVILCAALGIPLFLAVRLFVEKTRPNRNYQIMLHLGASLILILIYFSFPGEKHTQNTFEPYIRYGIYNTCIHLLLTFLPFIYDRSILRFWNYNIFLFTRILTSLFYSLVFFVGLVLALLALHLLFDIDFDEKLYPQLFALIVGLFNTWFFLSGLPENISAMDGQYPSRSIKIFAQYILLPLLISYLLILYGYGIKILLQGDWPRGIISYLVLCVAGLGIFNFLLLYPSGLLGEGGLIRRMTRGFYGLSIPLLILLFVAINMRVLDYGFTVNRYLIIVMGGWLAFTSFYFIMGKRNITVLPVSLAALLFFVSFGPWGMFAVSEKSQVQRLESILSQSHKLAGGKIQGERMWDREALPELVLHKDDDEVFLADSIYKEVSSIIHYLEDYHNFDAIKPWFSQDMDLLLMAANKDKLRWQRVHEAQIYMETIGFDYYKGTNINSFSNYSFESDHEKTPTALAGYDYLIDFNLNELGKQEFTSEGIGHTLQLNQAKDGLELLSERDSLFLPLTSFMEGLRAEPPPSAQNDLRIIPQPKLTYEWREGLKVEIHYLNFKTNGKGRLQLESLSGFLLFTSR